MLNITKLLLCVDFMQLVVQKLHLQIANIYISISKYFVRSYVHIAIIKRYKLQGFSILHITTSSTYALILNNVTLVIIIINLI